MAREIEHQKEFHVTPGQMVSILTDPALLDRQHRLQGATAVDTHSRREGAELILEVGLQEPRRTLRGVNRNRSDPARTVYRWNLEQQTCVWRYRGTWGERVRIEGSIRVLPADGGCRVDTDIRVEVSVPVIGSMIEKRIANEIQQSFDPFQELLNEFCRMPLDVAE